MKKIGLVSILALVIYIFMPTFAYGFFGIVLLFLALGFIFIVDSNSKSLGFKIGASIIVVTILSFLVIYFFTTAPIFHSDKYRNIIGKVETSNFTKDIAPIDINSVRIVDQDMAERIGSKVLGKDPSLGSRVKLGEFNIQQVRDKLYWVAPLIHKDFFKWYNKPEGTTGYVMVSATNEEDVKLVQSIKGKDILIKYQNGAFFGDNIYRHIYFNGYMTKGITDFTFEIDDDLNPYWVVTLYEKRVGFKGCDAIGVIVVDAQSGDIKEYSIKEAPKWVDRIQPKDFIITQLNDWGRYIKGWVNGIFAQDGVLRTSQGISLVYGEDGKSYWYTGMTSTGQDGSSVGFVLVDTRTKKTFWYKQSGATELRAMSSARGMVQEKGYYATFPILYNVSGVPTYIMSLKDNEGLIKMIAMVSVEHYNIVGIGKDIKSALRNYKSALSSRGNVVFMDSITNFVEINSTILRINRDVKNGNMLYYFQLKDNKNKIFITDSRLSEEIILTKVGDNVSIKYEEGNASFVNIDYFDNHGL